MTIPITAIAIAAYGIITLEKLEKHHKEKIEIEKEINENLKEIIKRIDNGEV